MKFLGFKKNRGRSESGVAILIAITAIAIISFIAVELAYDSASEYVIASQEVHRLKSRYAAKAGIEIGLLRILLYKQAQSQFGQVLGNNKGMLDQIWSLPFMWPPQLPDSVNEIDKGDIQEVVGESLMDATYNSTIVSEGSKIDLTDLASPSKSLREITKTTLVRLIENRLKVEDEFARKNRDLDANYLVNNIVDWIDSDSISLNSSEEASFYAHLTGDSKESNTQIPPNQPFKTMEELHMVAGMTDELYDFISPQVTIYGLKAIQVNHATKEVIMGLDPLITSEIADAVLERRSSIEGPFKDKSDFLNFLNGRGLNSKTFQDNLPPLIFDSEYNFRIKSVGIYGRTSSEIVAIVYDFDKVKEKLTESLTNDKNKNDPNGASNPAGASGQTGPTGQAGQNGQNSPTPPAPPKGRPNIVYWVEN